MRLPSPRQIGPPGIGTTDRTAYLAAIDGMMYGDDPADGAIRGRTFIHPRLGFLFVAPEGFVLENSAQAVLGVKSGGLEALRLDSVRLADTTSLESYIGSGWIDGLLRSSVQSLTVNGMPAVTAIARAGEWNFRVAVIRFDPTLVYRMIFAIHNLDDDAEKRFRASIDSFRHTTPEEAARVLPLHIVIVTARDGDKAETLATKMAVDQSAARKFRAAQQFAWDGAVAGGRALQNRDRMKRCAAAENGTGRPPERLRGRFRRFASSPQRDGGISTRPRRMPVKRGGGIAALQRAFRFAGALKLLIRLRMRSQRIRPIGCR